MEIGAIASALSGIKTASDIARIIKDSGTSLESAEIKFKLADLIYALAEAKIEIADFKELLSTKDDEIKELKKTLKLKQNVIWQEPSYYIVDSDKKDGPYCQRCYDVDVKLVRLQSPNKNGFWKCSQCTNNYKDSSYNQKPFTRIQ
ncbi:hypothetical protein C9J20_15045 [Photobacterium phosphoreum]|jgi:hypothetical protein|uniref:hypothetical protein n=1 Tax=Photobacterium phosphoreum TaxID=659 RepID=UPI000D17A69E|nr:hypothetical protein [Photobacterium phosphoreum]PSU68589.1 hypothetical protein CTM79_12870 [Photobacterium phosphoreum]PSW09913.1 hypothetical protein C9J20_15045 [Photobacterium phosphoreum]